MASGKYNKDKTDKQVYQMSLLGLTDVQMANVLGIAKSTFNKWKIDFPTFSDSIKKGKIPADAKVSASLFKKACGFKKKAVKIFNDGKGGSFEHEYNEYYPPDTAAAFIWLKNRQPDIWKDKKEPINEGTPQTVDFTFKLIGDASKE